MRPSTVADLRRLALCLALTLGLSAIPAAASWYIANADGSQASVLQIAIPPGTADQIQAGAAIDLIPSRLNLGPDDRLLIENNDSVAHSIGNIVVAAGARGEIPARNLSVSSNRFLCSFHSGGWIGVSVAGRSPAQSILWPTLIVGAPLGLVAFGVSRLVSKLST